MAGEKDSAPVLPKESLEEQFHTQAEIVSNGQDDYARGLALATIDVILDAHLQEQKKAA